jgi:hypothetical protein
LEIGQLWKQHHASYRHLTQGSHLCKDTEFYHFYTSWPTLLSKSMSPPFSFFLLTRSQSSVL